MVQSVQEELAAVLRNPKKYRKLSEQHGDTEFQAEIAHRLGPVGYAYDLDPSIAESVHLFPGDRREQWTTSGHYNAGDTPHTFTLRGRNDAGDYGSKRVTLEPGHIQVLGHEGRPLRLGS